MGDKVIKRCEAASGNIKFCWVLAFIRTIKNFKYQIKIPQSHKEKAGFKTNPR